MFFDPCSIILMINATDLKRGVIFKHEDEPYEVNEAQKLSVGGYGGTVKGKATNLLNGKQIPFTFRMTEKFDEAEIEKTDVLFLYAHRDQFWFQNPKTKERTMLTRDIVGEKSVFLKPNLEVQAVVYENKMISIKLPIKISYKVLEAPPSVRGNTAQGGSKQVTLEGGHTVSTPLFVEEGDTIVVNTDTGEYVERL